MFIRNLLLSLGLATVAAAVAVDSHDPSAVYRRGMTGSSATYASTTSTTTTTTTFVQRWEGLSTAFAACQKVFKQQASTTVAVQAVHTLYTEMNSVVSDVGDCRACSGTTSSSEVVDKYQRVVVQIIQTFQEIITTGQQTYTGEWTSEFQQIFGQFGTLFVSVRKSCERLGIDLEVLLGSLNLDISVFHGIGIEIKGLLNISIGGHGGLLGIL